MKALIVSGKSWFFIIAMCIVGATIYYARYLAKKIDAEERQRVAEWIAANQALQTDADTKGIALANLVISNNEDIPLIATDLAGNIIDYHNLDNAALQRSPDYLATKLASIQKENAPVEWAYGDQPEEKYLVYYGNTLLQKEVQYYPLVQLVLVALFIGLLITLITTQNRSTQNLVWAGMAKESAHQMGTPLTSLRGWIEVLKESHTDPAIVEELEKDVNRLILVSDRFGKIGSVPQLELCNLIALVQNIADYMRRRASGKVQINTSFSTDSIALPASPTLLEWVLENLIKNALDAMDGKGTIDISVVQGSAQVTIDVQDTGKGMSSVQIQKIFNPGFTTKKRGWGLGLTLSKRIMQQYHKGQLFVKHSEPGKGTTFRMVLPR
jgi:signal transduction histidine kinase